MIYSYKSHNRSEAETELEEEGMTDSLKTEVPEISDVSQDPHDEVKVLMIVTSTRYY